MGENNENKNENEKEILEDETSKANDTSETDETVETNTTQEDEQKFEDEDFEELTEEQEEASSKKELEEMKLLNNKIKDENTKLKNELDTVKERLLRTVAEYENYRNRTAKEKDGIYNDACFDVLKNMLPALDNMERAAAIDGNYEDLKQGIDMTIRQFRESLSKLGVEEISSEGEFDPNLHNAIMHVEDDSFGENQIVEVLQKGYQKGDKVIRFSLVKVAN